MVSIVLTLIKLAVALAGGSAAMMGAALHGLADAFHQGLRCSRSGRTAHPRGVIALYLLGSGLGLGYVWHAWRTLGSGREVVLIALYGPYFVDPWALNIVVLLLAFAVQGYAFKVAVAQWLSTAQAKDRRLTGLMLEGALALLGLGFATLGAVLMLHSGNAVWDLVFAVPVALMPALVAACLWREQQRNLG